jgi:hypothetical protein
MYIKVISSKQKKKQKKIKLDINLLSKPNKYKTKQTNRKKSTNKARTIFIKRMHDGTKLCLDSPWMIPFQICVWQSRLPTNMATVAKNRKMGDEILLFSL